MQALFFLGAYFSLIMVFINFVTDVRQLNLSRRHFRALFFIVLRFGNDISCICAEQFGFKPTHQLYCRALLIEVVSINFILLVVNYIAAASASLMF